MHAPSRPISELKRHNIQYVGTWQGLDEDTPAKHCNWRVAGENFLVLLAFGGALLPVL